MSLISGTKLGPYEIVDAIGAGGMGEVYRARDTRLDRTVAVKTIKAANSDRFQREARAISALNHPHICSLYDVGPDYLVMEYVEGSPIKGPYPLAKALDYAIQIAEALDAAHRRGIVHRDLKPANILVTKAGIKLLDFGLARMESVLPAAQGETISRTLTVEGSLLGTVQYMSPEQLEGKPADARSDIFAFGLVLHELITGRRAFEASSHASLIAAILTAEPPSLAAAGPPAPASLERVLRKCLAKDPERRWQSARDLADELAWIASASPQPAASIPSRNSWWRLAAACAAMACIAAAATIYTVRRPAVRAELPAMQFQVPPPDDVRISPIVGFSPPALSPDGRWIAYVGSASTSARRNQIWIRPLADIRARVIEGTDNTFYFFWSPDSRQLGFFADGKLKRVAVEEGAPIVVADAPAGRGGAWTSFGGGEGTIVFARNANGEGLFRVGAAGGTPVATTSLSSTERAHRQPKFFPDGKRFMFSSLEGASSRVYWADLTEGLSKPMKLMESEYADFAPSIEPGRPGHLLFVRNNALLAQPFDPSKAKFVGEMFQVVAPVETAPNRNVASVSVSRNGLMLYRPMGAVFAETAWFDRSGRKLSVLPEGKNGVSVTMSPSADRAALTIANPGATPDLWVYDFKRNVASPLANGPQPEVGGIWSPDGRSIAYGAIRDAQRGTDIFIRDAAGATAETRVWHSERDQPRVVAWTPDGKNLIIMARPEGNGVGAINGEIYLLPLESGAKPVRLTTSAANVNLLHAALSRDGRWLAYASSESGGFEIYVCEFKGATGLGSRWKVSNEGGATPRWRADTKELFYMSFQGAVTAVPIGGGKELNAGTPAVLFETGMGLSGVSFQPFDVNGDGSRFIMTVPLESALRTPMVLLTNWLRR